MPFDYFHIYMYMIHIYVSFGEQTEGYKKMRTPKAKKNQEKTTTQIDKLKILFFEISPV